MWKSCSNIIRDLIATSWTKTLSSFNPNSRVKEGSYFFRQYFSKLFSSLFLKGGLILEKFSFWLNSPKMGAKSQPWALFTYLKRRCSGLFFGTHFLEIWAKVKNFLRLSYLWLKFWFFFHPDARNSDTTWH